MPTNEAPWASIPGAPAVAGACTSCSIRICGLKYATCGPATITGCPLTDSRPDTSSAFEALGGKAEGVSESPPAGWRRRRSRPPRARWSEPASGRATLPRRTRFERTWYGNRPRRTVTGASRSSAARKSRNTLRAAAAEPLVERGRHLGPVELVAAAAPEDAADERRGGDQVLALPRVRPLRPPDRGVLARQLRRVELRLGDVLVDAGDVVVASWRRISPCGPSGAGSCWAWRVRSASVYGATAHCSASIAALGAAGEARQLRAPGVAQHVHEEQPVLGARVAEAEHRAVAVASRRRAGRRSPCRARSSRRTAASRCARRRPRARRSSRP